MALLCKQCKLPVLEAEYGRLNYGAEHPRGPLHWVGTCLERTMAELAAARAEVAEVGKQLEADRTVVADAMTAANRAIDSRHWLTEGRGSYEWNDDRFHEEFLAAALEIKAAIAPLTKIGADWTSCPRTGHEIAQARIDLQSQRYAAQAEIVELKGTLYAHTIDPCLGCQMLDGQIDAARQREGDLASGPLREIAFWLPTVTYEHDDLRYVNIEEVFALKRIAADAREAIAAAHPEPVADGDGADREKL